MPASSRPCLQHDLKPLTAENTVSQHTSWLPLEKQQTPLTQAYYIAASARSKLSKEAYRADHNLRLLVGHANLLDNLMAELQNAKREQKVWFDQTMAKTSKNKDFRHSPWADTIANEYYDYDYDSDSSSESYSESDSDFDDEFDMIPMPHRTAQAPIQISTAENDDDEDEEYYDAVDVDAELTLTRVSLQIQLPPELVYKEDSEDDKPPKLPSVASLKFFEKESLLTTTYYTSKTPSKHFEDNAVIVTDKNPRFITSY